MLSCGTPRKHRSDTAEVADFEDATTVKGLSCDLTLIAKMLGTIGRNLHMLHRSTAAKTLRSTHEFNIANYFK